MKFEAEFIENLVDDNKAENTISAYISDIKIFETFVRLCIENINHKELRNYINYLESNGTKPHSINRKIASIKSYVKYINEYHNFNINLSKVKLIKICSQKILRDSLTIEETKRIIKQAEKENDIRAVCIIKTLLLTGGRVSEVLQIKLSHVNNDFVTVKGKGGKYRDLLISKKLSKQFQEYIKVRKNNSDKLFTGVKGAINRQTVHAIIKKYAGKSKIKLEKAHAHAFRHLYTKILFDKKVSYSGIQQLLGHNLTVTEIYGQLNLKELKEIINNINI